MAAPMRVISFLNKYANILKTNRQLKPQVILGISNIPSLTKHCRNIHCQSVQRAAEPLAPIKLKKMMETLTDKFSEAREMLQDARESQGTVYFSEDMEEAQEAVTETLKEYANLLSQLSDTQRREVLSTLGLRMEELKAQQAAIEETLKD